ncbi:MAG TPA: glycoside hydrolase family 43 protein [Verrucomicrobiae bacterium]|nr:glycoside hydrolase family 43 protein [Verrucomicrobiae bacterium]
MTTFLFPQWCRPLLAASLVALLAVGEQAAQAEPVQDKDAAYLFAYFKDDTHSLYFALSRDGYTFEDVNGGKPIMGGTQLAEQKGIRDPHIVHRDDGSFYLAMTDLHIFGRRAGFRTNEWERPAELYDWGNNRAIVMMRSTNLIQWSHSIFRIDKAFEETRDVGCFWAPETIYDAEKGRLMVYFTMRLSRGPTKLYYSYADDAFTKLETVPQELFKYPGSNQILDADITRVGSNYHMFYVAQGAGGGIKQAVSGKINRDYVYDPAVYDPERVGREAPNVWRRLGTETYVLMYDVFGVRPSNMGFSETTDFKTFKHLGRFNEGVMKTTNFSSPKHGSVIHITTAEARALANHWKFDFEALPQQAQ